MPLHPTRLLLGPGPSNVHPRVLEAMSQPMLGHLDPEFLAILEEVQAGLRILFNTQNHFTLPLSATGSAGMETCLVNLLEPGDRILVGANGVFGTRMADVATRAGAEVTRVDQEWGTALDEDSMLAAIEKTKPQVVSFVHAETSTGVHQSPKAIARAARDAGALVVLDCVTSLAGIPVELDQWGIDAAYSATQKCLSCPPGLSPVSFSERALERVQRRKRPVQSWYLDTSLLSSYYGSERIYHHTAPISAIFGIAAGLELVLDEGMEKRAQRHRETSQTLLSRLARFGFAPLVREPDRLPMLTTVLLPEQVQKMGEAKLRGILLNRHGIEVGGGLGELAGRVWRIGLMGENARAQSVDRLIQALDAELPETE